MEPFVPIDPMNVPTKCEVRSIIRSWDHRGYAKKLSSPWIRPRSLFLLFFGWTLWMYRPDLKSVALPIPDIIAIRVFGGVANLQYRERGRNESGTVPFERALVSSYRPPIVTLPLSLRVSEILPLLCSSTPLFPTLPPQNFPMFPWD